MTNNSLIGQTILGYTIEEELGSGSFGKVYRVSKTNPTGRFVRALKRITLPSDKQYYSVLSQMGGDVSKTDDYFSETLNNLLSEIRILNELTEINNPNIVRYYENDVVETRNPNRYDIFILMEYLTPLDKYILSNELTVEDVVKIGLDVLKGLETCHKNDIIHRDIKIENIFVTENKNYKIGDVGVAEILSEQFSKMPISGTENVLSPEVYAEIKSYSSSDDLYALGMLLYRLLNYNRNPFLPPYPEQYDITDEQKDLGKRMQGETPNLPAFGGEKIGEVIVKSISKPTERYKTAEEFYDALKRAVDQTSQEVLDMPVSLNELKLRAAQKKNSASPEEMTIDEITVIDSAEKLLYPDNTIDQISVSPQNISNTKPIQYSERYSESTTAPIGNPNMNQAYGVNEPSFAEANDRTSNSAYYPPPAGPEVVQKKSNTILLVIIGILVLGLAVALGLLAYQVLKPSEPATPVSTTTENTNGSSGGTAENNSAGETEKIVPIIIDRTDSSSNRSTDQSNGVTAKPSGNFYFPDSSSRYLTEADLQGMNETELILARNEISARNGRRFDTDWIQNYFNSMPWYTPIYDPEEFDDNVDYLMNDYEITNMNFIKSYEDKMGYD